MEAAPNASSNAAPQVERTPWLLLGSALAAFGVLALTTVQGALASNSHASAFYRQVRDRELHIVESAGLDYAVVQRGRTAFLGTCTACHGPNGEAKPNLGKDLAHSEFVAKQSNSQLRMFLKLGRPTWDPLNTTKVDMPGKGGNPMLSDGDLAETSRVRCSVRVPAPSSSGLLTASQASAASSERFVMTSFTGRAPLRRGAVRFQVLAQRVLQHVEIVHRVVFRHADEKSHIARIDSCV
ncbi:MAG: cytochrome c [Planctomycetota bacterium]